MSRGRCRPMVAPGVDCDGPVQPSRSSSPRRTRGRRTRTTLRSSRSKRQTRRPERRLPPSSRGARRSRRATSLPPLFSFSLCECVLFFSPRRLHDVNCLTGPLCLRSELSKESIDRVRSFVAAIHIAALASRICPSETARKTAGVLPMLVGHCRLVGTGQLAEDQAGYTASTRRGPGHAVALHADAEPEPGRVAPRLLPT